MLVFRGVIQTYYIDSLDFEGFCLFQFIIFNLQFSMLTLKGVNIAVLSKWWLHMWLIHGHRT